MRRIGKLLAAIGDSGVAAIGTLVAGIAAVALLTSNELATYGLVFAGWVVAGVIPRQLSLIPMRTATNLELSPRRRSIAADARASRWSLGTATVVTLFSGAPMIGRVDLQSLTLLAISASIATVLGAMQEHARASLHVVRNHVGALTLSSVASVSTGSVVVLSIYLFPEGWAPAIPFGSLSVGYGVALAVSASLYSRGPVSTTGPLGSIWQRQSFLGTAFLFQSVGYLTNLSILILLGAQALATFESVRVFAAPVLIIGTGLGNALKPPIISALGRRDPLAYRRGLLALTGLTGAVGLLYLVGLLTLGKYAEMALGREVNLILAGGRSAGYLAESVAGNLGAIYLAGRLSARWTVTSVIFCSVELALLVPSLLALGLAGPPVLHGAVSAARLLVGLRAVWDRAT